jgi:hypothetical protein
MIYDKQQLHLSGDHKRKKIIVIKLPKVSPEARGYHRML